MIRIEGCPQGTRMGDDAARYGGAEGAGASSALRVQAAPAHPAAIRSQRSRS